MWWHPLRRERHFPAHGYPRFATHALARMYLFADELLDARTGSAPAARRVVLVQNARETACSNGAMTRLVKHWRRHAPEHVSLHRLDLPFSHDIIEAERAMPVHDLVYPRLLPLFSL